MSASPSDMREDGPAEGDDLLANAWTAAQARRTEDVVDDGQDGVHPDSGLNGVSSGCFGAKQAYPLVKVVVLGAADSVALLGR